jgi:signal peptidase
MSSKLQKLVSAISNILIVIIILFAAIVSLMAVNAKNNDNIPSLFGYTTFSIQTDSMEGTINPGDLIVGKVVDNPEELEEEMIISFHTVDKDGKYFINTHKIIKVIKNGSYVSYQTKGDNEEYPDERKVAPGDVISVYTGVRIPLLGYVITFLSGKLGFFLCIVLPVLLYTIWQVYKLVVAVMHNQKLKIIEEAQGQTSDEVKQAIINEYLAKQKELEQSKQENNSTTD